jgi:hypothetical protein
MIEVKTKMNKQNALSYFNWGFRRSLILIAVLCAVLVFLGLWTADWFSVFLGIWVFVVWYITMIFIRSKMAKNKMYSETTEQTFTFNDDHFVCETTMENGGSNLTIKYSDIKKVIETKQYFFIKINITQVYVVPKADITSSEKVYELKALLSSQK